MTVELRMLALSVVLGVVQIVAASHAASLQRGYRAPETRMCHHYGVCSRAPLRALRNFLETFPLFAAVILAAHVSGVRDRGRSLRGQLAPRTLPEDRTIMSSCWSESGCLASIKRTEKYVYNFDDAPDEFFDLSEDPLEKRNIAAAYPEEVEARRAELLERRAKVNAMYGSR